MSFTPQWFLKMKRLGKIAGTHRSPFPGIINLLSICTVELHMQIELPAQTPLGDDKNKLTKAIEGGFISLANPGQAIHVFYDCVYPILV